MHESGRHCENSWEEKLWKEVIPLSHLICNDPLWWIVNGRSEDLPTCYPQFVYMFNCNYLKSTMLKLCIKMFCGCLITSSLVGCSGEPSSSDIKSVVEAELKPALEMQSKMLSGFLGAESGSEFSLKEVNKLGCKSDGDNAYKCDVELVMSGGKTQNVPLRFVEGTKGWVLSQ